VARSPALLSGRQIAENVLGRLLDRVEARIDRQNRVTEPLPEISLLYDDREELHAILGHAEAERAVKLEFGRRENRHNIEKVVLLDPEPLYRLLGRRKPAEVAAAAGELLVARLSDLTPEFRDALDRVISAWSEKRNLVRDLRPDDIDTAVGVFKAASALLRRRRDDGMDMRTFSRRSTGSSKFVEGNIGKIADVLRMVAVLPEYFDAADVLAHYGIQKWPHACLLAGPVTYKEMRLPAEPYIGIAPEMSAHLGVSSRPGWLLTIENLASFNRQVREAAGPRGIVVYTGGFPSDSTLAAILALAGVTDCPIFHWGDIDGGGIRIAYRIERALADADRRLALHLMTPAIAIEHGSPEKPSAIFSPKFAFT
jgi:Uncharacterized protein conserved in bacteria C-term(DUF2220)/Uncharacterized protein conserved in bacteria N-term (DUF3322)